jgi:hypothetical protein
LRKCFSVGNCVGDMVSSASDKEPLVDGYIRLPQQTVGAYAGLLGRPELGTRWVTDYEPIEASRNDPKVKSLASWGPWLIPITKAGDLGGYDEVLYPVFRHRGCRDLHRKFARLATVHRARQREEIRRFAGRFGFLGSTDELTSLYQREESKFDVRAHLVGEHFRIWEAEFCETAALLALWDLIQKERRGEVVKYIFVNERPNRVDAFLAWKDRRLSTDRSFGGVDWRILTFGRRAEVGEEIADERTAQGRYRLLEFPGLHSPKPDVLVAARLWLFDRINDKLWGRASPQLKPERQVGEQLLYVPHSLLGAIYLYFAQELEGRSAPGTPCANPKCDRTIDATWNRKYCNASCRDQARYYLHHEERRKSRRTTPISTPIPANDGERARTN